MALHIVVPRFVVIVLREIIFVVFLAFKEVYITAARFGAPISWKLLRWIMALSVCAVMHQYAPFQVTKIGRLGRDVSHACQLLRGCLDPLMSMMLVKNPINHECEEEDGKLLPI